jgi:hypothetical protein
LNATRPRGGAIAATGGAAEFGAERIYTNFSGDEMAHHDPDGRGCGAAGHSW